MLNYSIETIDALIEDYHPISRNYSPKTLNEPT